MLVTLVVWVFFASAKPSVHAFWQTSMEECQQTAQKLEADIRERDMTVKRVRSICITQDPPPTT